MTRKDKYYLDDHDDKKAEEECKGRSARLAVGIPRLHIVFDDAGSRAFGPVGKEGENANHNDRDSGDQIAPTKVLGGRRIR